MLALASWAAAQDRPDGGPPLEDLLLLDRSGDVVPRSSEEVDPALHPPADKGAKSQIPTSRRGAPLTDEARRRIADQAAARGDFSWFPSTPPTLPPYLGGLDEFGNTAIEPGALWPTDLPSVGAQRAKYAASDIGLRYTWLQSYSLTAMSNVAQGASTLQYYSGVFVGKWAIYDAPRAGLAGWLSTEVDAHVGLTSESREQSPQANLRSLTMPVATVYGPNGLWLSELAWQQSLLKGEVVLLAGLIDQSNYLDENTYANYSQGQLMNSAFVNSMVLPLPYNNLGFDLQWQSHEPWYVLFASGANNQLPGGNAFSDLGFDNWSHVLEIGLTPRDVFGLGPGVYRLQPFVATVGGVTQAGVGINVGQRLGRRSPFGYFGRFGVGGSAVTVDGARAQIATGVTVHAPLKALDLAPSLRNDYFGSGFVWSQASQAFGPRFHDDEYGFEATYVLQLTRTATLQPDVQVLWNRAGTPDASAAVIAQIQATLFW